MPYRFAFGDDCVVIHVQGAVTGRTIANAIRELMAHEQFLDSVYRLWDAREVTSVVLSLEELAAIREASEASAEQLGTRGVAAILVSRAEDVTTATLFRAHLKKWRIQVFQDDEAARAWLREQRGVQQRRGGSPPSAAS